MYNALQLICHNAMSHKPESVFNPFATVTQTLGGHGEEVLGCLFNYQGDQVITASKDNTCRLWR